MLSAYVNEKRDDWSDHLDLIMMAYRLSVHQYTQCTLNLIMFVREVNLPLTVELGVFPCRLGSEHFRKSFLFCETEY